MGWFFYEIVTLLEGFCLLGILFTGSGAFSALFLPLLFFAASYAVSSPFSLFSAGFLFLLREIFLCVFSLST